MSAVLPCLQNLQTGQLFLLFFSRLQTEPITVTHEELLAMESVVTGVRNMVWHLFCFCQFQSDA